MLKRQKTKFYIAQDKDVIIAACRNGLSDASKLAKSLFLGKLSNPEAAKVGSGAEALDVLRIALTGLVGQSSSMFIKNSLLHLIEISMIKHHSFAAWLALYLCDLDNDVSTKEIMILSEPPTTGDLEKFYGTLIKDLQTADLFSEMRIKGGLSSKALIKTTPGFLDNVVHKKKHSYGLRIPQEFWRTGRQKIDCYSAKVLVVDGVIMTVSEIHRYLDNAHRLGENMLLVCRGFSVEVLSTLIKNHIEGRLNVFPVQISDTLSANMLFDIARLAGAHAISTITGDMIATKDDSVLGSIMNLSIFPGNIEFETKNQKVANELVEHIESQRNEARRVEKYDEKIEAAFNNRISAANAEICSVYVSEGATKSGEVVADRLKNLTKLHGEIREAGVVKIDMLPSELSKKLMDLGLVVVPTFSLVSAIAISKSTKNGLLKAGAYLTRDKEVLTN